MRGYVFTPHAQASKGYVIGLSVCMHLCIHVTHYLGNMAIDNNCKCDIISASVTMAETWP